MREIIKNQNKITTYINFQKNKQSYIIKELNDFIEIDILSIVSNISSKYIQFKCIYNNKHYIGVIQESFYNKHIFQIPNHLIVYQPYVIIDEYILIFIYVYIIFFRIFLMNYYYHNQKLLIHHQKLKKKKIILISYHKILFLNH